MIQFDTDPQQTMLSNLQTGLQIVATINMEDLMDGISLNGEEKTALLLGKQLIDLLRVNGSLVDSIDPVKYEEELMKHIHKEYE